MSVSIDDYGKIVTTDFMNLFCGEEIGKGVGRTVYESRMNTNHVIKIEHSSYSFQNIHEWDVWNGWKDNPGISKWFAPCIAISPCGIVMIQEKTVPAVKVPDKIPFFFTDYKKENYGMIGKQFVCHDYGFLREELRQRLVSSKNLKTRMGL